MYQKHHTKGIVVSGRAAENDSRRINIFTERFGFLSAKVQGARNQKSKLRQSCQDFSCGEFSLVRGRGGWKVVGARADKNFFEIFRGWPERLKIAGNILNLLGRLVGEEANTSVDGPPLFKVVFNFFNFLELAKDKEVASAEALTLMRILHCLGYMRSDPEISLPISSSEISTADLETIAPRRARIIKLINESLKAA